MLSETVIMVKRVTGPAATPVPPFHGIDRPSPRIYNRCSPFQEAVSRMNATRLSISCVSLFGLVGAGLILSAADSKSDAKSATAAPRETIAKPLSDKEKKRREDKLRKELETPYKKWLNEDVAYIITDEERTAFRRLQTDDEREQFIEQFWLRRDPTPDSVENEFKEEHSRRIAYANQRYASGIPGWKTDRGTI